MEDSDKEILEQIFDYFNLITQQWRMASDKHTSKPELILRIKAGKEAIDKEFEEEEIRSVEVPSHLTKKLSKNLLMQKEQQVNQVVSAF